MTPKFSDRIGITQQPAFMQMDSMNEPLRNSIWNLFIGIFEKGENWTSAAREIAVHFVKVPLDTVPQFRDRDAHGWLSTIYFGLPWHDVYNLLEFMVKSMATPQKAG